jgi:glycosyltransferase involved in cell wall biosynthesis
MHIVQLNYTYDPGIDDPEQLLERYHSLTGWGEALLEGGASRVTTVQRFMRDAVFSRRGVDYLLMADGSGGSPRPWTCPGRAHSEIARLNPDLVHVHGMIFPMQARMLATVCGKKPVLLVQDHGGGGPPRRNPLRHMDFRYGLKVFDSFLFSTVAQAEPWRRAGLIGPEQTVYEVMEASTTLRAGSAQPGAEGALPGNPSILWVGRLNRNKDPLTVLSAFEIALGTLREAHLTYVYQDGDLVSALEDRLACSPLLAKHVHLRGYVPYGSMAGVYTSADMFVSGSHSEGSGYALIEALACGLAPVVSDIPSFRALTCGGRIGVLCPPGDAPAFARAMIETSLSRVERTSIACYFEQELSWKAVGRRAMEIYRGISAARRSRSPVGFPS